MWTRRRLAGLAVAVALALAACSSDTGTPEAEPRRGDDAGCDPELAEGFEAWADAGFSGSIAVSTGGRSACLAAYGDADQADGRPNTVDTVFSIGSISKAVAGAAVLDLVDQGRLSLDDRAGDLVPGLDGPVAAATVEQLLLHTSGLAGSHGQDHVALARDEAVAAIGGLELASAPGADFLYSNAGYTLLALIVEDVSGRDYRDQLVDRVLPPAAGFWDGEPAAPGPRAVGYRDDGPTAVMGDFAGPHWALAGNGDVAMTVEDLATWTHSLFAGEAVSPAMVDVLTATRFDLGDGTAEAPGWVAYDDSLLGEPFFATAGGGGDVGHNAVVVWLPESEQVVAMASNTPDVSAEALLQAVGPALVAGDPLPAPEGAGAGSSPDVDPDAAAAVAGTYALADGGSFEASPRDGRLAVAADGKAAVAALFPPPDGVADDEARAHEAGVVALLDGSTQEGREERDALAADIGPIEDVAVVGTVVDEGELRTYVVVTGADEELLLWYALDDGGGIAAAEGPTDPPTLLLVPLSSGSADTYRPDDPTGTGPDVTVTFTDDGRMTVTGPAGTTEAVSGGA